VLSERSQKGHIAYDSTHIKAQNREMCRGRECISGCLGRDGVEMGTGGDSEIWGFFLK
jgi:hypothetical protein